jgi:hypothetical protein
MIVQMKESDTFCVHAGSTVTFMTDEGDSYVGKLTIDTLVQLLDYTSKLSDVKDLNMDAVINMSVEET